MKLKKFKYKKIDNLSKLHFLKKHNDQMKSSSGSKSSFPARSTLLSTISSISTLYLRNPPIPPNPLVN